MIIVVLLLTCTAWGLEKSAKTRVAIYKDRGTTTRGPVNIERALQDQADFAYAYVTADEIRHGVLAQYDAVVLPGGTASVASTTLGEEGRQAIVDYVRGGGGYLGVCAGAYLATCRKAGDLGLINAYSAGGGYGDGMTKIRLTEQGQKMFGTEKDLVDVYYANGPLLKFADDKQLPAFTALAHFETDLPKETPPGLVQGKVAAACAPYGKGRVFCFSPHPERPESTGLQYYIRCALRWTAGKDPAASAEQAAEADRGHLDADGNWSETDAQKDRRMAWWRDARFGMFIHWGLYSVAAGQWEGKWQTNKYGEWIQIHFKIPVKQYETLAARFNPKKFDADAWVRMAADAGMKYIVITAKHHDGFAMFRTKASPFNIVDATPYKHDPMADLAAACRKYGLRLCFYYSQSQDWHEPDGLSNYWDFPEGVADKSPSSSRDWVRVDFQKYIDRKAMPQVRELLTQYGPVGLIWYDTPRTITEEQAQSFVRAVRALQPQALVNSRISRSGKLGDYGSTGDNSIPGALRTGDWEMPGTMNHTWGYRSDDHDWLSSKALIRNLVDIASKGGNYLLNVGPTAEGEFPPESVERLRDIGAWMKVNRESIYGTHAGSFGKMPWGRCTVKGNKLYLHVFDWPQGPLVFKGLASRVKKAWLLADPAQTPLKFVQAGGDLQITVPANAPDENVSVIVCEVEGDVAATGS